MDHLLDILLLADIGLDRDSTASTKQRGDLLHSCRRALLVDVRAHNLGALRGEQNRGLETDTTMGRVKGKGQVLGQARHWEVVRV